MEIPSWTQLLLFGVERWNSSDVLQSCGIEQISVPLSHKAAQWLRSSGTVVLPELPEPSRAALSDPRFEEHESSSTSSSESSHEAQTSATARTPLCLPVDEAAIEEGMRSLGTPAGSDPGVVPRLAWTAPVDAVWASRHELQCRSVGEIWNLLACSEVLSFDLTVARQLVSKGGDSRPSAAGSSTGSGSSSSLVEPKALVESEPGSSSAPPPSPEAPLGGRRGLTVTLRRYSDRIRDRPHMVFRIFASTGPASAASPMGDAVLPVSDSRAEPMHCIAVVRRHPSAFCAQFDSGRRGVPPKHVARRAMQIEDSLGDSAGGDWKESAGDGSEGGGQGISLQECLWAESRLLLRAVFGGRSARSARGSSAPADPAMPGGAARAASPATGGGIGGIEDPTEGMLAFGRVALDVFWDWDGDICTGGTAKSAPEDDVGVGEHPGRGAAVEGSKLSKRGEHEAVEQVLRDPSGCYGSQAGATRGRLVLLDVSPWWEGVTETPCTSYEELLELEKAASSGVGGAVGVGVVRLSGSGAEGSTTDGDGDDGGLGSAEGGEGAAGGGGGGTGRGPAVRARPGARHAVPLEVVTLLEGGRVDGLLATVGGPLDGKRGDKALGSDPRERLGQGGIPDLVSMLEGAMARQRLEDAQQA